MGGKTSHPARGAWIEIQRYCLQFLRYFRSHPARGAWIEISSAWLAMLLISASHPARGAWIEIMMQIVRELPWKSHPARGAWIEMCLIWICRRISRSRTPQGVRGLKCAYAPWCCGWCTRRTPQGVRGLKYRLAAHGQRAHESHPARGAWIEIRAHR